MLLSKTPGRSVQDMRHPALLEGPWASSWRKKQRNTRQVMIRSMKTCCNPSFSFSFAEYSLRERPF